MSPPLEHLELDLEPDPGPLLPQVRRALFQRLGSNADALRWAITKMEPPSSPARPARLTLEAVILRLPL